MRIRLYLLDVNILIYAFRKDSPHHGRIRPWLTAQLEASSPVGLADVVLSGFLRVVTHPRVFKPPTPFDSAMRFADALRAHGNFISVHPSSKHWPIFTELCRSAKASGNLVSDAYLAALAIESGCVLASTDEDFSRFKGLRWENPLD